MHIAYIKKYSLVTLAICVVLIGSGCSRNDIENLQGMPLPESSIENQSSGADISNASEIKQYSIATKPYEGIKEPLLPSTTPEEERNQFSTLKIKFDIPVEMDIDLNKRDMSAAINEYYLDFSDTLELPLNIASIYFIYHANDSVARMDELYKARKPGEFGFIESGYIDTHFQKNVLWTKNQIYIDPTKAVGHAPENSHSIMFYFHISDNSMLNIQYNIRDLPSEECEMFAKECVKNIEVETIDG